MNFDAGTASEILKNIAETLQAFWKPMHVIAYVIGVGLFIAGCFALAQAGTPSGRGKIKLAVASIISSCLLLSLPGFMDILSETIFDEKSVSAIAYSAPAGHPESAFISVAVGLTILVGLYSIIKGIVLIRASAEKPDAFWGAVTHMVGGVVCVNIVPAIHLVANSMGPTVGGMATQMLGS